MLFNALSNYNHTQNGGVIPTATWALTSNMNVTGVITTVPTASSFAQSFGNFNWSNTGQTSTTSMAGNLATVNGNFIITSTGSSEFRFSGSSTTNLTVGGTFTIAQAGKINCITSSGGSAIVTINGNSSIDGTLNFAANATTTNTFNLNGDLAIGSTGVISNTSGGAASINFLKTGAQNFTITSGAVLAATTKVSWSIANTSNVTLTGNFTTSSVAGQTFTLVTAGSAGTLTIAAGSSFTHANTTASSCNFNGKSVTLKSSIIGTASLGTFSSAPANATNITAERYLAGGASHRRTRLLASPVTNGTALQWRNNGTNAIGLGIQITGNGGVINNFDVSGNSSNPSSAWTYTTSAVISTTGSNGADWVGFTDGNMTLTNGTGYRVLVRGDRLNDLTTTNSATTNTTIFVTGSYPTSPVTISTIRDAGFSNGWNLIGNPYPSAISWNALTKGADLSGSYQIFDPSSNAYVSWNGTTGSATDLIASGQGFFVLRTSGISGSAGDVTINEANKSTAQGGAFFGKKEITDLLKFTMKYDSFNYDDSYIHFRADAFVGPDNFDALKFNNPTINSCTYDGFGNKYNINSLPSLLTDEKIIPISVFNSANATYFFEFSNLETFSNTDVYLIDTWLKVTQKVSNDFKYNFTLSTAVESRGDGRFQLMFKKTSTGLNAVNVSEKNNLYLFPNPAKEAINIGMHYQIGDKYNFEIHDQLGQQIRTGVINFTGTFIPSIAIDELNNGVYFITISNNKTLQKIKFIK